MENPPQHQFLVFSVIDENDLTICKYSQCNNCGVVHKVTDICKSEIMTGKENMSSIMTVDDIKQNLPSNLVDILERNNAELPVWEQASFILENEQWGSFIILSHDSDGDTKQGKYVRVMSSTFFKIETFTREEVLKLKEQ